MSRTLSSGMLAVTTADIVRPIYLVRMVFDATDLNLWTGVGNLAYGGNTYTGLGDLLSISNITETSDIQATGITVSLGGIKESFLAITQSQEYQGRPLTVSLGAFDGSGGLIVDPVIVFSGFMDTMIIAENAQYSTISVSVENKLISFERSKVRRYTAEDQKIDYPTDKGFEFVTAIAQKEIMWGRATSASAPGNTRDDGNVGPGYNSK